MAIIKDYISKGGVHIMVDDSALDNSPEHREEVYRNLSIICSRIELNAYLKQIEKEEQEAKKKENAI